MLSQSPDQDTVIWFSQITNWKAHPLLTCLPDLSTALWLTQTNKLKFPSPVDLSTWGEIVFPPNPQYLLSDHVRMMVCPECRTANLSSSGWPGFTFWMRLVLPFSHTKEFCGWSYVGTGLLLFFFFVMPVFMYTSQVFFHCICDFWGEGSLLSFFWIVYSFQRFTFIYLWGHVPQHMSGGQRSTAWSLFSFLDVDFRAWIHIIRFGNRCFHLLSHFTGHDCFMCWSF